MAVSFRVPDVGIVPGTFTVTCYEERTGTIHTRGHCFPSKGHAVGLRLLSTSGFRHACGGNRARDAARARARSFQCAGRRSPAAHSSIDRRRATVAPPSRVWVRRDRSWLSGTVLAVLRSRLEPSHPIGRWTPVAPLNVTPPLILVQGSLKCERALSCVGTQHGWSGAPWMVRRKKECVLVGMHVARVELRDGTDRIEVAVLRPPLQARRRFEAVRTRLSHDPAAGRGEHTRHCDLKGVLRRLGLEVEEEPRRAQAREPRMLNDDAS